MIKLKYAHQVHLGRLPDCPSFQELQRTARRVFPALSDPFEFFFEDEEGDELTISSQQDLTTILQLHAPNQLPPARNILRLHLRQIQQPAHCPPPSQKEDDLYQQLEDCQQDSEAEVLDVSCSSPFEEVSSQTSEHSQSSEVLEVLEGEVREEQLVRSVVRRNLQQLSQECIANYMHELMVGEEVESYLDGMYSDIENAAEIKQKEQSPRGRKQQQVSDRRQQQEVATLIERSLHKLLPHFISTATQLAVDRVTLLLQQQSPLQRPPPTPLPPAAPTPLLPPA